MVKTKIELKIKNICLLKQVSIDISGLTVISGENDQGKSTVGKALMALIKANNKALSSKSASGITYWGKVYFDEMLDFLFDTEVSSDGQISIYVDGKEKYSVDIKHNQCEKFITTPPKDRKEKEFVDCTFIQTPLIWDLEELFNALHILRGDETFSYDNFDIRYPYILRDLYAKLALPQRKVKSKSAISEDIKDNIKVFIKNLIGGEFIKKRHNKIHRFYSLNKNIPSDISLKDIAIGMKTFGIIQVLMEQNCFTSQGYFIFDEPENHLHPDWQLKFAVILTTLAYNGIHIMVNTHSPFMIKALNKCAEILEIPYFVYWAQNGEVNNVNNKKVDIPDKLLKVLNEPNILSLENDLKAINNIY